MAPPLCRTLLIGLPSTGKTTFLAALWYVAESGSAHASLKVSHVEGDREHLNRICNTWSDCQPLERTRVGAEQVVSMTLVARDGGTAAELVVPDMSGESFEQHLEHRRWPHPFDEFAGASDGVMLFVHPDRVREPLTINQVHPLEEELAFGRAALDSGASSSGASNGGGDDDAGDDEDIPWHAGATPTQVQLIDLLQLVLLRSMRTLPLRLAVVVSAWDVLGPTAQTPEQWLATTLPMLHQFITANPESLEVRVYGMSAQGGDLTADADRLAGYLNPVERIEVRGSGAGAHDITAPIRWFMERSGPT